MNGKPKDELIETGTVLARIDTANGQVVEWLAGDPEGPGLSGDRVMIADGVGDENRVEAFAGASFECDAFFRSVAENYTVTEKRGLLVDRAREADEDVIEVDR